jgi:hypothetical protein
MDITSFDNMYEEDGIALVSNFLAGLNAEPVGPMKRVLIAIVPEYDDAGRLQRLDCVTVPTCDPGSLSGGLGELMEAVAQITAERRRKHDAAIAKLDASEITVVKGMPPCAKD